MSIIDTSNIDQGFPIAAQDNDSQGFRNNFTNLVTALDQAKVEIEVLEALQARIAESPVPPPTPKGIAGDLAGMAVYQDGGGGTDYIYVCFKDHNGTDVIWARTVAVTPIDDNTW